MSDRRSNSNKRRLMLHTRETRNKQRFRRILFGLMVIGQIIIIGFALAGFLDMIVAALLVFALLFGTAYYIIKKI